LVDSKGNLLVVEEKKLEITDEPVKVYNFKVDDFHTYHVGKKGYWYIMQTITQNGI